jgi:hypothetical protein
MYILYLGWFIISLLTIFTICGLDFGAVLRFMMPKSELVNRSRVITKTQLLFDNKNETKIPQLSNGVFLPQVTTYMLRLSVFMTDVLMNADEI